MRLKTILKTAEEIRKEADVRDIDALCEAYDILLLYYPMGTLKKGIKGFLCECHETSVITLNADLPEEMRRVVFYHEFAHCILHLRTGQIDRIEDCDIYDAVNEAEYEANLLAAELEIPDEDVLSALSEGRGFFEIAEILRVPAELLDFKLRLLREKGYNIPGAPIAAKGSYLASAGSEAGC